MDKSRVKNFIILLLLLVNVTFLLLWAADSRQSALSKSGMEENVRQMLSDAGVSVSDGVELIQEPRSVRTYYRDPATEERLVESVLGDCSVEDQGGNIYFYSGANGQGRFRGTGEFELLLDSGAFPVKGSYISACAEIIKKLGMSAAMDMDVQHTDGGVIVTAMCRTGSAAVYNCLATFTFSDSELHWVQGTRIFDIADADDGEKGMDSATAISFFAKSIGDKEILLSSVTGLECGYILSVTVSGECALTPAWRFSADTGDYYINALTGRLQTP